MAWDSTILKAAALLAAVTAICGSAWAFMDYTEVRPVMIREFRVAQQQLEDMSQSVLLLQFQLLLETKKFRELTVEEQIRLCRIAEALKFPGAPGC
jgi:hypothetical protein